MMLGKCNNNNNNFIYGGGDSSYGFDDDNSSLDSGIERSYEHADFSLTPRKLDFNASSSTCGSPAFVGKIRKRSYRNSKISLEEYIELEREFQPQSEAQTSTPKKRRYAQGKCRISRSQSPTQITKIRKFRRIKANDRERTRMHSLNEALGKFKKLIFFIKIQIIEMIDKTIINIK